MVQYSLPAHLAFYLIVTCAIHMLRFLAKSYKCRWHEPAFQAIYDQSVHLIRFHLNRDAYQEYVLQYECRGGRMKIEIQSSWYICHQTGGSGRSMKKWCCSCYFVVYLRARSWQELPLGSSLEAPTGLNLGKWQIQGRRLPYRWETTFIFLGSKLKKFMATRPRHANVASHIFRTSGRLFPVTSIRRAIQEKWKRAMEHGNVFVQEDSYLGMEFPGSFYRNSSFKHNFSFHMVAVLSFT